MKKTEKTDVLDMLPYLEAKIPGLREYVSPVPIPADDQDALLEKLAKEKPETLKSYLDEKSMHKSMNMADPEAIEWANKTRADNMRMRNSKIPKIKAAGIAAALLGLASGDVTAAIPGLSEAEALGPEQGSEDWEIENPQRNPAARRAALEKILKK